MICKNCGSEFEIEKFDLCPYCLTPVELEVTGEDELEKVKGTTDEEAPIYKTKDIYEETSIENADSPEHDEALVFDEDSNEIIQNEDIQRDYPIEKLNLSARAYNVLKRNAINTMGNLLDFMVEKDLHEMRNAGAKTVDEILHAIEEYHITGTECDAVISDTQKEIGEEFPFMNMSRDVEGLSILAVSELGLSTQTAHAMQRQGWKFCADLKMISASEIIKVVRKNNYSKVLQVASWLENDIISLLQKVLDETANERDGKIFLRRSMGDTLQSIADNPGTGDNDTLTRERVRQIERKYGLRIIPFVRVVVELLRGKDDYVLVQDLLELYDNDDYDRILLHACKMLEEYQYFDFADMLVRKKDEGDMELTIMQSLGEYIGDGKDIYDNIEEMYLLLSEKGFGYLDVNAVKNLLRKYGYKIYGDYVSRGKVSYGILCIEIIKKHFPMGIKLSQSDSEQTEDLVKLRELAKIKFADLELPDSDRALSSTLVRCGLVLRGRGLYIPEDCIEIDENILHEIKKSIDEKPENRVFYRELYSEFEGVLNFTCGIDNYNYLHGVLMKYYPVEYEYSRDYLLKNGTSELQAETIADRIYEYICEMGRPVTKKELMNKFQGLSNIMIMMPFLNDKRLLQWEYNQYSCTGILNINQNDKDVLQTVLIDVLGKNNGYASDAMFYKRVKTEHPLFLEKNKVTSDMNLYYIASNLFDDICDFRRPHIGIKGKFEKFSTKDIVLNMLEYPEEISYEKYRTMAEKMEWSPVTTGMVFSEIEKDYIRISDDMYIKNSAFKIAPSNIVAIREAIFALMEDGILPLINIDMDDLPEFEYQWNEFVLASVIKSFCSDMVIVQPAIKDRRYQKGIAVLKEKNIDSYPQIVANMMERFGIDNISESQFLSFLVVHNLTKKMIPNELSNSDFVKKVGDSYVRVI